MRLGSYLCFLDEYNLQPRVDPQYYKIKLDRDNPGQKVTSGHSNRALRLLGKIPHELPSEEQGRRAALGEQNVRKKGKIC